MRVLIAALVFSATFAILPAVPGQDSLMVLPNILQYSEPTYPPLARQARIQGDVRVKVTTDGESMKDVGAVMGNPLLGKAAEDNVRTWKFASHSPGTFYVTFRYKLASEDVEVEFLKSPGLVEIKAPPVPIMSVYYAWIGLGTWKAKLTSSEGRVWQIFKFNYSGPHEEWLDGSAEDQKGNTEEIDFGHKEGDFLAFTIKLRYRDGKQPVTFFVGRMKENKLIGTFVDDAGITGEWRAIRLADGAAPRPDAGSH